MHQGNAIRRWLWTSMSLSIGMALVGAPVGYADPPGDSETSPYPDSALILRSYEHVEPDQFFIADHAGVWFISPTGLNCGIWDKGSFGCAGDIPGAPQGASRIGWFNGDRFVHYDWTVALQFPGGQAVLPLRPRSYVTYNGTSCAATSDGGLYCNRGLFRFFVTTTQTWLNG